MPRNQKIEPLQQNEPGVYTCAGCSQVLFAAKYKFSVGSGFPSFWQHVSDHVKKNPLATYGRHRIQLLCSRCGQHLGHLFEDARTPTNLRYCINAEVLDFNQNITL